MGAENSKQETYINKNWNWKLIIEMDFIYPEFIIKHLDKLEINIYSLIIQISRINTITFYLKL